MFLPDFPCDINAFARTVPFQKLNWSVTDAACIPFYIRRDDLIDKAISGNKFYKLFGHLTAYFEAGMGQAVASFGGAYSNHLYALAAAGQYYGFQTKGIVRGEKPKVFSETLLFCQKMGMKLHFISRQAYKNKTSTALLAQLDQQLGDAHYWIPEGGGGENGRLGAKALGLTCSDFADGQSKPTTFITACGTATTFCAMVQGAKSLNAKFIGVPVLKTGAPYLNEIKQLLDKQNTAWDVWQTRGHCGGYAKFPEALHAFLIAFEKETQIMLDPVYTVKVLWALKAAIKENMFTADNPIVFIHTGGLQGRLGFKQFQ